MQISTINTRISKVVEGIPLFPDLRKLEVTDKNLIENFTNRYLPYSDYNFASLWCYNVNDDIEISQLHGNLVVKFSDYLTQQPFFSFMGDNNCLETTDILLAYAKSRNLPTELKLIPEEIVKKNPEFFSNFTVVEDKDNYDYVYSVMEVSKL